MGIMRKIIVTLKEPISDGECMKNVFEFDSIEYSDSGNEILVSNYKYDSLRLPIPLHNVLGVVLKKEKESDE